MSETIDYNKFTVNNLKEELKKRNLDQSGKKADLIQRLEIYNRDNENDDNIASENYEDIKEKLNFENGNNSIDATEDDQDDQNIDEEEQYKDEENDEAQAGESLEEDTEYVEKEENESSEVVEEAKNEDAGLETTEANQGDPTESESVTLTAVQIEENEKEAKEKLDKQKEDDDRISKLFGIEMRRERDNFQIKWHGKKFTVPFIGELISDLADYLVKRSFCLKNVSIDDAKSDWFKELLDQSQKYFLDFYSGFFKKDTTGQAKFLFANVDECQQFKEKVKEINEKLVPENIKYEDDLSKQFAIVSSPGSIVDRLIYVGNLPLDVTEETLKELFPDALQVIFPPNRDLEDKSDNPDVTRYVYLEYPDVDILKEALEKYKDLAIEENKLFIIKTINVRKERFGLLTDTLRLILIDKNRKMKKLQKNTWNKSRQEINEIQKAITMNLEKLTTDKKHRLDWGMELGCLDEARLDTEEDTDKATNNNSRGGYNNNRGRGGNYVQRRGGMNNYNNYYSGYNNQGSYGRGGGGGSWNNYSNYSSGMGWGQNYGNNQYGGKRKSNDGMGSDFKRSRGGY